MLDHAPLNCPINDVADSSPDIIAELAPLIAFLQSNQPVDQQTTFPRGTIMPDGRLDLCKQQLGPNGCRMIVDALANNTTITSILLGTDAIGDVGAIDVARLIERNNHLDVVYLGCNYIGANGVSALAAALSHNTDVMGLWLKRNPIGPVGAQAVASMLRQNTHLRTLDLVNTQIGADGLATILDALIEDNRTVERLYLGGNQIGPEAAKRLADLISENRSITALLLNVNQLGDDGAQILAAALAQNQTLIELGLASNGIHTKGACALLDVVRDHRTLTHLDLGYSASTRVLGKQPNALGDTGAEAVCVLLAQNATLQRLDLRRCGISKIGKQRILGALEHNTTLHDLFIDSPPNPRMMQLLERNRALQPRPGHSASDVALIRSVYRTVVSFTDSGH